MKERDECDSHTFHPNKRPKAEIEFSSEFIMHTVHPSRHKHRDDPLVSWIYSYKCDVEKTPLLKTIAIVE